MGVLEIESFLFSGDGAEFFKYYIELLRKGEFWSAVRCWDMGTILDKIPFSNIAVVAALIVLAFSFSFRGIVATFVLEKVLGSFKTLLIFAVFVFFTAFILRFVFAFIAGRFLVTFDASTLSNNVRVVEEKVYDDKVVVRYLINNASMFEAVLKRKGDSFKIMKTGKFVGRVKNGEFKDFKGEVNSE
ncbi:hypothetical protein SAMN06265340_104119 [Desulfurobacterium atlanticum]|uniref:Uncharacterized protein n=1 Tax=Desulfurobacterium atlanticum TaxID=240169 RepID=A0A238YSB3_9BACT|nr:hypothetical protein SAMN06265340_104119 [Desulfurobacterium atlanticum]